MCAEVLGDLLETGGRVNNAARTDVYKFICILQGVFDLIHIQGNFAKPDDVRAAHGSADRAFGFHRLFAGKIKNVIFVFFAAKLIQVAVHMQDAFRAGAFMQVVYVLGDEQKVVAEFLFELGERDVCRIRFELGKPGTKAVVKILDALFIAEVAFGCCDRLDRKSVV